MGELKASNEYDGTNWNAGDPFLAATATDVGGEFAALAGVMTDAMAVGGYTGGYHGNAESYNGTSWSAETDPSASFSGLNQHAGSAVGAGHEDYMFAGGTADGTDPNGTYHFDGTTWTQGGNLTNDRFVGCMNGTTGDAIFSQGRLSDSELYDGGNWSTGPAPSAGRYSPSNSVACSGSANGVVFGGGTGSANSTGTNLIQEFDEA